MHPRYSPPQAPQMPRSNQVRMLWVDFEVWHAAQLESLESRVAAALRDLDTKWRSTKPRRPKKDLEEQKTKARLDIEKTLNGNIVRQEWDRRLLVAGMRSDEWIDMTPEEQRKVEMILGADLDFEDADTTILDRQPHPAGQGPSAPAPPLASTSRSSSISDTYAVVDPNSFSTLDDHSYDTWLEVRRTLRSDDEVSLDASTASSSWGGWTGADAPAYASWSSEVSRSSTQSSRTSSPEWHPSKSLVPESSASLLASATQRLSAATERSHDAIKSSAAGVAERLYPNSLRSDSLTTLHTARPTERQATEHAHPRTRSKSRGRYVGPHLTESGEVSDEEAEFERWKLALRIQKIQEFHNEAANADISLTLDLDEARRSKQWTKEEESMRIQMHEAAMLDLRQTKEEERKSLVEAERQKRRAALRQRPKDTVALAPSLPTKPSLETSSIAGQKFLKDVQVDSSSNVSETPTIRQSAARRTRKQSLQTDWASGNDTPTPTARSSGWAIKGTGKAAPASALSEAPPLKRLATAPASSLSQSVVSSMLHEQPSRFADEAGKKPVPVSKVVPALDAVAPVTSLASSSNQKSKAANSAKDISGPALKKLEPEPVVAAKVAAETKTDAPKSGKKGKGKKAVMESETEGASSSKQTLEQMTMPGQWGPQPDLWIPKAEATATPLAFSASTSSIASTSTSNSTSTSSSMSMTSASRQPSAPAAIPDNRRVWLPPAAVEANLNKRPMPNGNASLATPLQIQTSISGSQVQEATSVADGLFGRGKISNPVPTDPRGFEFSTLPGASAHGFDQAQAEAKHVEALPVVSPPSSILKKPKVEAAAAAAPATKSSKKKGKKKVTIEEAEDESEEVKGIEKLPVDSRYILEPKPVVPQAMFSQIFEYGADQGVPKHADGNGTAPQSSSFAPPTTSSDQRNEPKASSANNFWIPDMSKAEVDGGVRGSMLGSTQGSTQAGASAPAASQEKRVRWTPSAYEYDAHPAEESGDLFLNALDSLEAIVRGGANYSEANEEDSSSLNVRLGSDVKTAGGGGKRDKKGRRESNAEEGFWQHAMASLGRGGNSASAM